MNISFSFNILRMARQNWAKFFIYVNIDKTELGIVTPSFFAKFGLSYGP